MKVGVHLYDCFIAPRALGHNMLLGICDGKSKPRLRGETIIEWETA